MMADNASTKAATAADAADCAMIESLFGEANLFSGNVTNSTLANASFLALSSSTAFDWVGVRAMFFVNPVFCAFGILGNLMTIIVL